MRRFSSYGPVDKDLHYYAPRKKLVDFGHRQMIGEDPSRGGHYITVWGPRQTGKSWAMRDVLWRIQKDDRFDVLKINLEHLKMETDPAQVLSDLGEEILQGLGKDLIRADTGRKFQDIFAKGSLEKPLILILDEFDALAEDAISAIVGAFRNIYNVRQDQSNLPAGEKDYLLHSAALIGVRRVLGVENAKGSPFNVQRSLHIPNLTFEEVETMFRWHEKESGQRVDQEAIERLFYETNGQPGLTCWFGELLTEGWDGFELPENAPVDMALFKRAYLAAESYLPNNNILNIISKARQEPCQDVVLDLFRTDEKALFSYDDGDLNFLYLNGVIDIEKGGDGRSYAKFSCPFVQKRLFAHFARRIYKNMGGLYDPFEDLDDAINEDRLNVRNIMKRHRKYLVDNREWIFKNAPRRSDMRIYEAVFHFNLYTYLSGFIRRFGGELWPEFPTGNGKIDLVIQYAGKTYGIEVKSYTDRPGYADALKQAASYGKKLNLKEISLVFFTETISEEARKEMEADFRDPDTGVTVAPIFVGTRV
ncbi:conserved hypothetical protein [Candidatus Desulfarcum epimagneticum]|uniref:ORC1/DEAH AAA+ ATPase domain-containing protein n=1 Tax=uncultured Desulfobacteraceae bacterium TaxID=218296 RepID=A0A484HD85_9BACT|nr:conserved hypothetical protein [uncultured Desulfobacteraceae bacterium]